LLDTILSTEIKNKNILELGAGSGLISIACAKKGAHVTASDISIRVIEALHENSKSNGVGLQIVHSDLLDAIEDNHFDLIAINPPYYPKAARNELELAWYCGAEFEYFEKLFKQLGGFIHENTKVLMVLSEDCNLERIFSIAKKNHFIFKEIRKKKFWWEMNMIYKIEQLAGA
jgi:release factor glutamine methyltransferase